MPGLEDMKSKFAPAVKASRGSGGRHGQPFELPILPGAGSILSPPYESVSGLSDPKHIRPGENLVNITTPGSRMGGANVSKVMKEYKPISKVLKEKEF